MTTQRGNERVLLALVFVPFLFIIFGAIVLIVATNPYSQPATPLPTTTPAPVQYKTHVDSKKLKKKERDFVLAVESAYGQNMPKAQEKNVLTMGRTYCAVVGAGFKKAEVTRLYGKSTEQQEAMGVDLINLSMTVLCPKH